MRLVLLMLSAFYLFVGAKGVATAQEFPDGAYAVDPGDDTFRLVPDGEGLEVLIIGPMS